MAVGLTCFFLRWSCPVLQIDYIDESEVLTMADDQNHINKNKFKVPFVCGCRNLGEALVRRDSHTHTCRQPAALGRSD